MEDKIKEIEKRITSSTKSCDIVCSDYQGLLCQALAIIKEQQAQLDRVRDGEKLLEIYTKEHKYHIYASVFGNFKDFDLAYKKGVDAIQSYILGDNHETPT